MDKTASLIQHIKDLDLSKKDRAKLIDFLNSYNEDRSIRTLVKRLIHLLEPVEYLPLLKDIRNSIYKKHVPIYDKLINSYLYRSLPPESNSNDHRKTQSVATLPKARTKSYHDASGDLRKRIPSCKFYVVYFEQDQSNFKDFGIFLCDDERPGVKVGAVAKGSPASKNGIKTGDFLIELNGISLEKMPLKTVFKILPTLSTMRFIIRRHLKPEKTIAPSINPWTKEKIYPTFSSFHDGSARNPNLKAPTIVGNQRKLQLSRGSCSSPIGFTIRGGSDYGTSVFISSVDEGSLADHIGLKIGDCIVEVNGTSFKNISHHDAAQFIRCHLALELTIQSTGGIPGSINNDTYCSLIRKDSNFYSESREFSRSAQDLRPSSTPQRRTYTNARPHATMQSTPNSTMPTRRCKSSNGEVGGNNIDDRLQIRWKSTGDLNGRSGRQNTMVDSARLENRWKSFLTVNEYEILIALLVNYKKTKNVDHIVTGIIRGFGINKRLDILNDVKELIRGEHMARFNEMVRYELESNQFKKLSSRNSMPSSLSKLWFYQPEKDEKESGIPTNGYQPQYGTLEQSLDEITYKEPQYEIKNKQSRYKTQPEQPRYNSYHNPDDISSDSFFSGTSEYSSSGSEFREFSFGTLTNRRNYTVEQNEDDLEILGNGKNSEKEVIGTKSGKESKSKHQKSKSLKSRKERSNHDGDSRFLSSTDSSFHDQSNWILKRDDEISKLEDTLQSDLSPPASRRHVEQIFPKDKKMIPDIESDFSWPDVPESKNNKTVSYPSFNGKRQETANPLFGNSLNSRDKDVIYTSSDVHHGNSRQENNKKQYDIEVKAFRPTPGKHLSIAGEKQKYRIEPISPSMTIQSVTVHQSSKS